MRSRPVSELRRVEDGWTGGRGGRVDGWLWRTIGGGEPKAPMHKVDPCQRGLVFVSSALFSAWLDPIAHMPAALRDRLRLCSGMRCDAMRCIAMEPSVVVRFAISSRAGRGEARGYRCAACFGGWHEAVTAFIQHAFTDPLVVVRSLAPYPKSIPRSSIVRPVDFRRADG